MRFAGFWIRMVSYIIDGIFISIGSVIIHKLLDVPFYTRVHLSVSSGNFDEVSHSSPESMFAMLLTIGIAWIYKAWLQSSNWQATLGMKIVGIKIVGYDDKAISFWRATARHFASWLSWAILAIGYIMIAFTPKKQGLHDYIAQTYVTHKN